MIMAIAGKGGAGKTTITATLARLLARSGTTVVTIDADSNPNLAAALGVAEAARGAASLPEKLVSRRHDGPALTVDVREVIERYALAGPDGVRLLLMGMPEHAEQGCLCSGHATVSALLADLRESRDIVALVDMEASPEHLSRGTARHADVLLLVTEPYFRSLESARRQAELAAEMPIGRIAVVANKVRDVRDAEAIAAFCGRHRLTLSGAVPWSEAVLDADARAIPLLDAEPVDSAAAVIEAIRGFGETLAAVPSA